MKKIVDPKHRECTMCKELILKECPFTMEQKWNNVCPTCTILGNLFGLRDSKRNDAFKRFQRVQAWGSKPCDTCPSLVRCITIESTIQK